MRSSEYYHRQADLCVRMALLSSAHEERIRLIDRANEYRDRASQAAYLWTGNSGKCQPRKGKERSENRLSVKTSIPVSGLAWRKLRTWRR